MITFKCSAPSGEGHLRVRYENVSGVPDGEVLVPLQKGPLAVRDSTPERPEGIAATRAFGVWRGGEINFFREGYNESGARPAPQGTVGLVRYDDVSLVSEGPGNWLRIGARSARIAFWTDGNVGSNENPQMALEGEKLILGDIEIAAIDRGDPGLVGGYLVPRGGIILWSGAADRLPKGWALCDGQNGTPDLRDRFVLGAAGRYPVGAAGGAEEVTLGVDQMPHHDHGFSDPGHNHRISQFRSTTTDEDDSSLPVRHRDDDDGGTTTGTSKTGITFSRRQSVTVDGRFHLLDFEWAEYAHALLDISRLLVGKIEQSRKLGRYFLHRPDFPLEFVQLYRRELEALRGEAFDDAVWARALGSALVYTTLGVLGVLFDLPSSWKAMTSPELCLKELLDRTTALLRDIGTHPDVLDLFARLSGRIYLGPTGA